MSGPLIRISPKFPEGLRPELHALICESLDGLDLDLSRVEIWVRAHPTITRRVGGITGVTYDGVPLWRPFGVDRLPWWIPEWAIRPLGSAPPSPWRWTRRLAGIHPDTAWLMVLTLPTGLRELNQHGPVPGGSWPVISMSPHTMAVRHVCTCWQDYLTVVAAHEARHLADLQAGLRGHTVSELAAEQWAAHRLAARHARAEVRA